MSLSLIAPERSTRWDGRLVSWRGVVEACLWWNQLGKQQQKRGWLRPGKPLCQLCSDFIPTSVRLTSKQRFISSAAASRYLLRTVRRWIKEARGEVRGGGCDRAEVLCDVRSYMCSLTKNGTTSTASSFSARLCPVWVTGWTTSRVACGSIPEPSEGRDPSCGDTGSHASNAIVVVHKAIRL